MKKILIWTSLLLVMFGAASCNSFFDPIPGTQYDMETTFADKNRTEQFLNNVYSYVPNETGERFFGDMAGIWAAGSQECKINWTSGTNGGEWSLKWNTGKVYSSDGTVNRWFIEWYKGISKASTFIQNVDKCHEATENDRLVWKAQARGLRAMYYFYIFRLYGPFVILGEEPLAIDTPVSELLKARNTVDECIKWMTDELEMAAKDLPDRYTAGNLGRIDAATCMALRAKILLYAASPLFNNNTMYADVKNNDGTQLFPQGADANAKWQTAKEAYEDWLEFYGKQYTLAKVYLDPATQTQLDPYASYRLATGASNAASNPELIFCRIGGIDSYCKTPYHKGYSGAGVNGGLGFSTSQVMVDMFFTDKGLRIEDDPDYDVYEGVPSDENFYNEAYKDPWNPKRTYVKKQNNMVLKQWINREPRFYATITFNGSVWLYTGSNYGEVTTQFTYGGNSGFGAAGWDAPYTGYGYRKPYGDDGQNSGNTYCCLLRLSDMYLAYAECCAETGDFNTALTYVNKIRERAGIPGYGSGEGQVSCPNSKAEVLKRVRRERLVELCYEWQRWYDVRRWKAADGKSADANWLYPENHTGGEGGAFTGMDYMSNSPEFFKKTVFEERVFADKMYFLPIPESDILRNPNMVQNYGWGVDTAE